MQMQHKKKSNNQFILTFLQYLLIFTKLMNIFAFHTNNNRLDGGVVIVVVACLLMVYKHHTTTVSSYSTAIYIYIYLYTCGPRLSMMCCLMALC